MGSLSNDSDAKLQKSSTTSARAQVPKRSARGHKAARGDAPDMASTFWNVYTSAMSWSAPISLHNQSPGVIRSLRQTARR